MIADYPQIPDNYRRPDNDRNDLENILGENVLDPTEYNHGGDGYTENYQHVNISDVEDEVKVSMEKLSSKGEF